MIINYDEHLMGFCFIKQTLIPINKLKLHKKLFFHEFVDNYNAIIN